MVIGSYLYCNAFCYTKNQTLIKTAKAICNKNAATIATDRSLPSMFRATKVAEEAPFTTLNKAETYRGDDENVCQWDHYRIAIDRACSHIHIANIKAPSGTTICMFSHQEDTLGGFRRKQIFILTCNPNQ
ncbi:hypothetical protein Lal_00024582 [Lupinus albus]|nr:hypothetical protein Lal_00024582 [Lupinus albus]